MSIGKTVLITGARAPVALHLARLMAEAGLRVVLADHLRWPLASASRLHAGYHRLPSFVHAPDHAAAALGRLLNREQIDLVIPTCEEVLHLAKFWRDHCPRAELFAPALSTLERVHNKHSFTALCQEVGLSFPETKLITRPEDLRVTQANATQLVYKPVWSRFGGSVLICPNPHDLGSIRPTPGAPWVAQEFVEGTEVSVFVVAVQGRITALAAYRAGFRAGQGAAIAFEPADTAPVGPIVEALVQNLTWSGQISLDLIQRPDGEVIPIECNPRATSGLHFFRDSAAVAAAYFGGPEVAPDVGTPQAVPLALWAYGLRPGRLGAFNQARRRVESVFDWPGDPVGLWPQLRSVAEFAAIALRRGTGLQHATTLDIEWDGSG